MTPRRLCICVIVVLTLISDNAFSEPLPTGHVVLKTGAGELVTSTGKHYDLPVGTHILDGTTWQKIDDEVKRAHEAETRYQAENKSLRESAKPSELSWGAMLVVGVLATIAGGTYYALH